MSYGYVEFFVFKALAKLVEIKCIRVLWKQKRFNWQTSLNQTAKNVWGSVIFITELFKIVPELKVLFKNIINSYPIFIYSLYSLNISLPTIKFAAVINQNIVQHIQIYKSIMRYDGSPSQPQLQLFAPTPPSTTPSPGQPHQQHQPQYHPGGPQPSPAGGGPPQYPQPQPQAPHFQMMCPLITGPPQLVPQYFSSGGQPQHHPQHMVLMSQQHPAQ